MPINVPVNVVVRFTKHHEEIKDYIFIVAGTRCEPGPFKIRPGGVAFCFEWRSSEFFPGDFCMIIGNVNNYLLLKAPEAV